MSNKQELNLLSRKEENDSIHKSGDFVCPESQGDKTLSVLC